MCYVGQTTKTLSRQWSGHCARGRRSDITRAIAKHGRHAFEISILEECDSAKEADLAETYWINRIGSMAPHGYNLKSGGKGKGITTHESTRARIREAWKKRAPFSKETRAKMSLSAKNVSAQIRALRVSYLQKSYGHLKGKPAHNTKRILCTTTGKIYRCAKDAAQELDLDQSTVHAVAKGKWKATKGYSFKYQKTENALDHAERNGHPKPILDPWNT